MKTFKIEETELVVNVCEYLVQADTEEEALDKYCDELAGSIEPVREHIRLAKKGELGDVKIIS